MLGSIQHPVEDHDGRIKIIMTVGMTCAFSSRAFIVERASWNMFCSLMSMKLYSLSVLSIKDK